MQQDREASKKDRYVLVSPEAERTQPKEKIGQHLPNALRSNWNPFFPFHPFSYYGYDMQNDAFSFEREPLHAIFFSSPKQKEHCASKLLQMLDITSNPSELIKVIDNCKRAAEDAMLSLTDEGCAASCIEQLDCVFAEARVYLEQAVELQRRVSIPDNQNDYKEADRYLRTAKDRLISVYNYDRSNPDLALMLRVELLLCDAMVGDENRLKRLQELTAFYARRKISASSFQCALGDLWAELGLMCGNTNDGQAAIEKAYRCYSTANNFLGELRSIVLTDRFEKKWHPETVNVLQSFGRMKVILLSLSTKTIEEFCARHSEWWQSTLDSLVDLTVQVSCSLHFAFAT